MFQLKYIHQFVYHTCLIPSFFVVVVLQAYVHTGEKVAQVTTQAPTFTVAWHPTKHLLAYACDDKVRGKGEVGTVHELLMIV